MALGREPAHLHIVAGGAVLDLSAPQDGSLGSSKSSFSFMCVCILVHIGYVLVMMPNRYQTPLLHFAEYLFFFVFKNIFIAQICLKPKPKLWPQMLKQLRTTHV